MKRYVSIIGFAVAITLLAIGTHAQVIQEPSGWFRSGNCWFSEEGFLYCGEFHPYDEENSGNFVSFACFEQYQAVLLNHPDSPVHSEIRVISSKFGDREYSDIWIAADPNESFMSNNVSATNAGYVNFLKGFGNPQAMRFEFSIEPGDVAGAIELTGEEYHVVSAFIDACSQLTN